LAVTKACVTVFGEVKLRTKLEKGTEVRRIDYFIKLFVPLALMFQGCAVPQNPYVGSCSKVPKPEIISLAMSPDPLPEARRIDQWRVIIRSDSSDLCQATLDVVESNTGKVITEEKPSEITLGANEIFLNSLEDYRLSGDLICFEVNAYIGGTKVAIKSSRRFCARRFNRSWFSMR
jgi:hypothetical protein